MTLDAALDRVANQMNTYADQSSVALLMQLHGKATEAEIAAALDKHRAVWSLARRRALQETRAAMATGAGVQ